METSRGFDDSTWQKMAQLGWQGVAIAEEHGGHGLGFVDLTILLQEMGRRLLCAPFLSSVVLAAFAIEQGASEDQKSDLLSAIAQGKTRATLALTEPEGRWEEGAIKVSAQRDGKDWRVSGTKMYVIDGGTAELFIVAARTEKGVSLFSVSGSESGIKRSDLTTLDMTRKLARVDFDSAGADLLGTEGAGWSALEKALDRAAVALSAEMLGGAETCLEMATNYARTRVQFGRQIGSFQAIKHKLATVMTEVEMARSAVQYAAWAAEHDDQELRIAAPLCKAYCSEAFLHAAAENIQVHGGIGFTWEHDCHLYIRRAKSSEIMLGDADHHRELLAQRLGI